MASVIVDGSLINRVLQFSSKLCFWCGDFSLPACVKAKAKINIHLRKVQQGKERSAFFIHCTYKGG